MKAALTIARVIVGLLFIFSGLVKANDPLGLSYKMEEFFDVWGWHFFNGYTLLPALIMNGFEILAGVAVLLGWRMRLFSWLLLLLIIFFTFLTGYAVLSGKIHACGCFGDCIPLTAMQSFIKDLLLLVLIIFIFSKRDVIVPVLPSATCGMIIVLTGLFAIALQWYVLRHLPIVDCLGYKVGNNIIDHMKLPAGAKADSFAISFIYKKNGKQVEFDSEHFPDDYDSTYEFIDRRQVLVREATGKASITDFSLKSTNNTDTTEAILNQPGYYVMLFLKDLVSAKKRWEDDVPGIVNICKQKKIPFYIVTSVTDLAQAHIDELPGMDKDYIHFLRCDPTVIKTAARENPTWLIMKQANILAKYADADHEKVEKKLKELR